jgi:tripartite-type tricarboxylate transporter receptor subunit TctC
MSLLRLVSTVSLLLASSVVPALAQSSRSTGDVSLYSGYPAGAAYEIYARFIARHMGRHLPGQPTVILRHMPGASSLILANYLANVAPHDGNTIGSIHERMGVEPLVNPSLAKFDGTKLTWIGSALKTTDVCMVWHTAPATTIEAAKTTQVIVGGANDAGSGTTVPRVLNDIVGTKFKLVTGYQGADNFLAMERGETEGRCGMSYSGLKASKPDWVRDKKVILLIQMGMSKHPELPDVPLIMDLVSKPEDRVALEFLFATQEAGRPYVAPPGIPEARKVALRRAFDATMKDPELLSEATRSGIELNPITGEEVEEIVVRLYKTPKSVIERVDSFRNPKPGEAEKK